MRDDAGRGGAGPAPGAAPLTPAATAPSPRGAGKGAREGTLVVLNPRSGHGGGRADTEAEVARACEAAGLDVTIARTGGDTSPDDAAREGLERGFGRIVAAGGDGTICAVASALVGTDATMGVLPMGTFNYFARSLGVPQDLAGAVEVLRTGAPRPVSVASINGETFLNNASLGAYAAILETREDVYRRWGRSRIAAYWSVVKTLATLRAPLRLTIEVGGESVARRTPLVFAVANAFQLDELDLPGRECVEAGGLALFVAPDDGRAGLMRHAAALALGIAGPGRDYELICGAPIRITTRRGSGHVARDGERSRMPGPFELAVSPGALSVLAPREGGTAAGEPEA